MISPKESGALNSLFPPARFVNERLVATKAGELAAFFSMRGIDADWQTDAMLKEQHADLTAAFRALPEDVRVYQYLIKTEGAQLPEMMPHPDPTVQETISRRREYLASAALSTIRLYLVLVYEPKTLSRKMRVTFFKSRDFQWRKLEADVKHLMGIAETFRRNTQNLLGLQMLDKAEIFRFLRFLTSLQDNDEPPTYDNNLDYWMGTVPIARYPEVRIGKTDIQTLTCRKLPQHTWPVLLRDLLRIRGNFIVCHQFAREANETVAKKISNAEDHYQTVQYIRNLRGILALALSRGKKENIVPDQSALDKKRELGETLVQLRADPMGRFSFTAIFWGENPAAVSEAQKVFTAHDGALLEETYWALGACLNIIPGTVAEHNFRQREQWLFLSQYIDLGLFYTHDPGLVRNVHLNADHLLTLRSVDGTVHCFNLHVGDLLGALLFGVMGSGKSVFASLCIDHSMKYNPQTLILDGLGGSYRTLTQKHGGNYFELDPDGKWPFRLNPFALPDCRKTRQHISMLMRVCLASGGFKTNARRNQIIYQAVQDVYTLPKAERRFSALQLPDDMKLYFAPWVEGGQYDFVFDNEADTFQLSRLQTIDFSAMDSYPDVLQPLLFHFFYRWDLVVNDPDNITTLKQMIVDEGWKMISYRAARRYIQAAGRTWRKRNGGILLATQSVEELSDANMLDIINVLCPAKLLLANPGADFDKYARLFQLNEQEVQNYRSLRGKGDLLWKAGGRSKVLHVDIDPESLWTYASSPYENARRDAAIREHGFEKALKVLAAQSA